MKARRASRCRARQTKWLCYIARSRICLRARKVGTGWSRTQDPAAGDKAAWGRSEASPTAIWATRLHSEIAAGFETHYHQGRRQGGVGTA